MNTVRPIITKTWALCLVVATFPWLTGGKEPLAGLLSAMALVLAALLAARVGALKRSIPRWVTALYLLLVGWGLISGFWTANVYSTFGWVQTWALAGGVFWLTRLIMSQPGGGSLVKRLYILEAMVFGLWGIGLYVWGDYDRLVGPIYWPNPAASYLLPAVMMAFADWLQVQKNRQKALVSGLVLMILGASIWLTASRAAIIILAFYSLIMVIVFPTTKGFWTKFLFAILASWLLSMSVVQAASLVGHHHTGGAGLASRVAEVADGQSQSLSDRRDFLLSAGRMWLDHPLRGTGAGTYGDVHSAYQRGPLDASANAHSLPAQILSELGLVGFGLLSWLVFGLIILMIGGFWQHGRQGVGLVLGVLAGMSHLAVDIGGSYPAVLASLAMLVALVSWQPASYKRQRFAVPMGLILLAFLSALHYTTATAAERGSVYLENEEYVAAARAYEDANKYGVGNPDWLAARGIVALAQGQLSDGNSQRQGYLDEALSYARQAEGHDSFDAQHWQLESRVWYAQNQMSASEAAAKGALARDPNNHPEYAGDLAAVLWRQSRHDEALAVLDEMLARYPPPVRQKRSADLTLKPRLEQLEAVKISIEASRTLTHP